MPDALYTVLMPTGLAASIALLLVLALRPALQRVPARLRRVALTLVTLLFLLPLPTIAHGIGGLLPQGGTAPITQALAEAGPAAPIYAAGEALGNALQSQADAAPAQPPAYQPSAGAEADEQGLPAEGQPAAGDAGGTGRPGAEIPPAESQAPATKMPHPLLLLGWAYVLGLAATAAVCVARYRIFTKRLRASSAPVTDATLLEQYNALCAGLGTKRRPALLQSSQVASPLLIGTLRPRIVLPESTLEDREFCGWALRHELVHHRHGDVPFKLLVQAVLVLHWYNPLCRLLRREVEEACEQSCDEAVVQSLNANQRKLYALSLLQCAEARLPYAAAGFAGQAGRLKKRLGRLLNPVKAGICRRAALLSAVAMVCCLGILAGCTLAAGAGSAAAGESTSLAGLLQTLQPEEEAREGSWIEPTVLPETYVPEIRAFVRLYKDGYRVEWITVPLSDEQAEHDRAFFDIDISDIDMENLVAHVNEYLQGRITLTEENIQKLEKYAYQYSDEVMEEARLMWQRSTLHRRWVNPVPEYLYLPRGFSSEHRGIDLKAEYGASVYAVSEGTVIEASYHSSYGYTVLIDHGYGVTTRYAHCSELLVETGQEVSRSDVIALVGSTGDSSGNQLHFEVRVDGEFVDPTEYLNLEMNEYKWPVPGSFEVLQEFDEMHRGIDIAAGEGDDICAASFGYVIAVEKGHDSYGNYVIVDHGGGMQTLYAHMELVTVLVGQYVADGTVIGTAGQTGMADSTCLHFEVIRDGSRVEPMYYFAPQ